MARKDSRRPPLEPGETFIEGAAKAAGYSVTTLRDYFTKLPEEERPPLVKMNGYLVGRRDELREWGRQRRRRVLTVRFEPGSEDERRAA